jgi:hypothetical protein
LPEENERQEVMSDENDDRTDKKDIDKDNDVSLGIKTSWAFKRKFKAVANAWNLSIKKLIEEMLKLWIEKKGESPLTPAAPSSLKPHSSEATSDPSRSPLAMAMPEQSRDDAVRRTQRQSSSTEGGKSAIRGRSSSAIHECAALVGIEGDEGFRAKATAFLVSYDDHGCSFTYLVTVKYAISDLVKSGHKLWLKVNVKGASGSSRFLRLDAAAFRPIPEDDDPAEIAVTPLSLRLPFSDPWGKELEIDAQSVGVNGDDSSAMTRGDLEKHNLGVSDEIAIADLLTSRDGLQRDIPIARFGKISAMPDQPVPARHGGFLQAYLVEAQSARGLCGAPVFVRMPDLRRQDEALASRGDLPRRFWLLGLLLGELDMSQLGCTAHEEAPGPRAGFNTGISVVVPTDKILEALLHPDLVAARQQVIGKR